MSKRKLAVSGQFYPDDINELKRYINHFNNILEENSIKIDETLNPRAIISPHAGYVYSGFLANFAYRYIPKDVKNIIVIGPSHRYAFDGASVALYDKYPTPFGDLDINKELSNSIINNFSFVDFYDEIHCEHSTETQFPFIKNYMPDVNVVEMVYGNIDYPSIAKVIEEFLKDKSNFIVISTDLSHFYNLEKAESLDSICLEAIEKKSVELFESGCEACGRVGVKAMLSVAKKKGLNTKILDYRTSADFSNDKSRVVGYVSGLIY
jgi:AmmeMemoRadiSam system protein B